MEYKNYTNDEFAFALSPDRYDSYKNKKSLETGRKYFADTCTNDWTDYHDTLLRNWINQSKRYMKLHTLSKEYYYFWHNALSIPMVILSTSVGMTTFAFISPNEPSQIELIGQYLVSTCSVIVAILSGILQLSKCSEYAVRHQSASNEYIKFCRSIQMELLLEYCHRTEPNEFCRYKKKVLDKLLDESIDIPNVIIQKLRKQEDEKKSKNNELEQNTDTLSQDSESSFCSI